MDEERAPFVIDKRAMNKRLRKRADTVVFLYIFDISRIPCTKGANSRFSRISIMEGREREQILARSSISVHHIITPRVDSTVTIARAKVNHDSREMWAHPSDLYSHGSRTPNPFIHRSRTRRISQTTGEHYRKRICHVWHGRLREILRYSFIYVYIYIFIFI